MEKNVAIKKIVLLGPESTGKTTLCTQLADHFDSAYVPEFAREYLSKNGKAYTYEDLFSIANGQLLLEDQSEIILSQKTHSHSSKYIPLFIDTDLQVIKVWSEFVFNRCDNRILNEIAKRKYDLYLLCNPDLPWVKDELREYPDQKIRVKLYLHYKELLLNQSCPWIEIKGSNSERFSLAQRAVESLF